MAIEATSILNARSSLPTFISTRRRMLSVICFRVACSLHSDGSWRTSDPRPGEEQLPGGAVCWGYAGVIWIRCSSAAFVVANRVRSETQIGFLDLKFIMAAVELAKKILE